MGAVGALSAVGTLDGKGDKGEDWNQAIKVHMVTLRSLETLRVHIQQRLGHSLPIDINAYSSAVYAERQTARRKRCVVCYGTTET